MTPIGIFGTSGHAREVGDIVLALGYRPVYVARDEAERAAWVSSEEVLLEGELPSNSDMRFTIGIGDNAIRRRVALRHLHQRQFINLVHPSATFGSGQRETLDRQQGHVVCAGVRFTNNIRLGDFCLFNANATVAHDVIVGSFVTVSPGAHVSGNVQLDDGCWVGSGAVVNQGTPQCRLIVGRDTMIGSGAVVLHDCDPGAVYVGAPAKRIK